MSVRYVLAPEAAVDLVQIWGYIKLQSGERRELLGKVSRKSEQFGVNSRVASCYHARSEREGVPSQKFGTV